MKFTLALAIVTGLTLSAVANAQGTSFLRTRINDTQRSALPGNVHTVALDPSSDRGPVARSTPIEHMLLQLQRSPAHEAAMAAYITTVDDSDSPNYHQWLSAQQIGQLYGPSHADITEVAIWLGTHGLTLNSVSPTGMVIDFSGTAAQIETAFHVGLHTYDINGQARIVIMEKPSIPTALVGIVSGLVNQTPMLQPSQNAATGSRSPYTTLATVSGK